MWVGQSRVVDRRGSIDMIANRPQLPWQVVRARLATWRSKVGALVSVISHRKWAYWIMMGDVESE